MKQLTGLVTSTKMQNTVIVKVESRSRHPLYGKIMKKTKNFPSHVEGIELSEGDTVVIQEVRPMSKTKRFKVVEKVK